MGLCEGRVAIVTGASRGIGVAIAERLAAEGASVAVAARTLEPHPRLPGTLRETIAAIEKRGGRALAVQTDLLDAASRVRLVQETEAELGPIDILVNNAATATMKLPSQTTSEERSAMYEVNLNAPVDLAQQALPDMRSRGAGWILNITSATAKQPEPPYRDSKMAAHVIGPYGATKAALDRYSEALAHEVAEQGIFVNAMGPVAIVLTQGAAYVRDIARKNPDMVEPVEMMAEAALELCTGRHVGRVIYSRDILHSVGRKVHSLDGKQVLGDAFMAADVEATA